MIRSILDIAGLKFEHDVIEVKENTPDGQFVIKKLPGRPKAGEVTITRALTADTGFERWIDSSQHRAATHIGRQAAIIVFDPEGNPIKRYTLTDIWPRSLEIGSPKAGDAGVLTEKLTIAYESMEVDGG